MIFLQIKNHLLFGQKLSIDDTSFLDDDWDRPWTLANLANNRINIFPNKNLISNIVEDNVALHSNPKKWNNLKLENIKFPLIHPKIICCDRQVDEFFDQ